MPLIERCRAIVNFVKFHRPTLRAFQSAQKQVYENQVKERKKAKFAYEFELNKYEKKERTERPAKPKILEEEEPTPLKALVNDVPTRWNSLLLCICRIIENAEALHLIWSDHGDGGNLF